MGGLIQPSLHEQGSALEHVVAAGVESVVQAIWTQTDAIAALSTAMGKMSRTVRNFSLPSLDPGSYMVIRGRVR